VCEGAASRCASWGDVSGAATTAALGLNLDTYFS